MFKYLYYPDLSPKGASWEKLGKGEHFESQLFFFRERPIVKKVTLAGGEKGEEAKKKKLNRSSLPLFPSQSSSRRARRGSPLCARPRLLRCEPKWQRRLSAGGCRGRRERTLSMGRGREYCGYNCKPASYVRGIGQTDRILLPGKKKIFVLKRLRHDDEKFLGNTLPPHLLPV